MLLDEGKTRLVKARNPWGYDSYIGEYGSETAQSYDQKVLDKIPEIHDDKDGYIFVPINQFKVSFEMIETNYNRNGMKMDYFLKLDDSPNPKAKTKATKEQKTDCGDDCILHDLHVVSNTA